MIDIWNDEEYQRLSAENIAAREQLVQYVRSKASPVTADYTFTDGDHNYTLNDFFGDHDDLIVVHNMGVACRHCTLWADGVNGLLPHLESRTAVVLVNEDPIPVQRKIAADRGWRLTMRRDADGAFSKSLGFAMEEDGKNERLPGYSTFHRSSDGTITHVASDAFGPGDMYMSVYPFFEMLKDGPGDWEPDTPSKKPISISIPQEFTA
ncbi:MAG: DUF899 family protein [bacterium]|nr:DUF899 family protein [bacterium]